MSGRQPTPTKGKGDEIMKEQFSTSECENIMEKLLTRHDAKCVSMYQNINYRSFLMVDVTCSGCSEINDLNKMNLNVMLFAQDHRIQMWLSKK